MEIKLKIDPRAYAEMLRILRAPGRLGGELLIVANKSAKTVFERRAKRKARTVLHRRTGRLSQSIVAGAEPAGEGRLHVWLGVIKIPYAAVHEFGAEIKPRRVKFLTIPDRSQLTKAGVFRGLSARERKDLYFDRETLTLRKKGTGEVVFHLRRKVKIPERPYLRPAMAEGVEPFWKNLARKIERALSPRLR